MGFLSKIFGSSKNNSSSTSATDSNNTTSINDEKITTGQGGVVQREGATFTSNVIDGGAIKSIENIARVNSNLADDAIDRSLDFGSDIVAKSSNSIRETIRDTLVETFDFVGDETKKSLSKVEEQQNSNKTLFQSVTDITTQSLKSIADSTKSEGERVLNKLIIWIGGAGVAVAALIAATKIWGRR